jgi:prophage regulatory protein
MDKQILRLPAVIDLVGLSRSTIYLAISNETFPRPIRLSTRARGWLREDIEEWLGQRIELSKSTV